VFAVLNPSTGKEITKVANLGVAETRRAIAEAQSAMQVWQATQAKERSNVLRKWFELILENKEDLAKIMTAEQGKVLTESRAEIEYGASFIEWFSEEAKRIYGDVIQSSRPDQRTIVVKKAVGVTAAITPWNFPSAMITRKAAPALAAGCAIVVKPSEETPLSALALAELARRAGFPAGIFNVLPTFNSVEVGDELTGNTIIKKLSFTESTKVGKLLLKQCSGTVKKTSMELGGNAPIIIFDDADINSAIDGIIASKYRNSGQICICVNRILVQDGVYDRVVAKLTEKVNTFKIGDGFDPNVTHGPLISVRRQNLLDS